MEWLKNPSWSWQITWQKAGNLIRCAGCVLIEKEPPAGYLELPAYETVINDKQASDEMFHTFYQNNDPITAKGLVQNHG